MSPRRSADQERQTPQQLASYRHRLACVRRHSPVVAPPSVNVNRVPGRRPPPVRLTPALSPSPEGAPACTAERVVVRGARSSRFPCPAAGMGPCGRLALPDGGGRRKEAKQNPAASTGQGSQSRTGSPVSGKISRSRNCPGRISRSGFLASRIPNSKI